MKPKTDKIGKLPTPTGSFEVSEMQFFQLLDAYHCVPQETGLKGKSPNEKFAEYVDAGWAAAIIEPHNFAATIGERETRKVRGDSVSVKALEFSHKSLAKLTGETVVVVVPKYHAFSEVRIEDVQGNFICNAAAMETYHPLDQRHAKSSFDRKRNFNQAMTQMDAETPDPDLPAKLIEFASGQPVTGSNTPRAVVSVTSDQPPAHTQRPISKPKKRVQTREEQDRETEEIVQFEEMIWKQVRGSESEL